jgi:hypothetical protein
MRAWTIPILGAVILSLAAPPMADAHPRLHPAMLLDSMAAPLGMFAGSRHSVRYYRRGTTRSSNDQGDESNARTHRRAPSGALSAASAPVFWPDASADLVDYLIFPRGKGDRFWAYDYGTIVGAAFAGSLVRVRRGRRLATGDETALPREPDASVGHCDRNAVDAER